MIEALLLVDVIGLPTGVAIALGSLVIAASALGVAGLVWLFSGPADTPARDYDDIRDEITPDDPQEAAEIDD